MRKSLILFLTAIAFITSSCLQRARDIQKAPQNFILVKGGHFINYKSKYYGEGLVTADSYVGKYEVSQKEWVEVMGNNPSHFKGENLPVETVSWYDCIEYCNKRSAKEGLQPYYNIDKNNKDINNTTTIDSVKWTVTLNDGANGYRLPTNAEWEYAATGGRLSKNFTYSGSNNLDDVAWYWKNSGDKYLKGDWSWPVLVKNNNKTKPIGGKKPNEIGLYDMAGNVREWCWDWHEAKNADDIQGLAWKGGGWIGADFCCASSFEAYYQANGKGPDQGLRVWRSL